MARLAWFSPMPPARSGVAIYSAEVVAALRSVHDVHVFVDEPVARAARAAGAASQAIRSAHDFVPLHARDPYDLTVFQLGNSSSHDFVWAYLNRYPGLTVLHDVHLHHARAASLLRQKRAADYVEEFTTAHPERSPDLAQLAIRGFDSYRYYEWPMISTIIRRSRVTAVHAPAAAAALRESCPDAAIERIRLGHGALLTSEERAERRARTRAALGLAADAVLFGVFGGLTPEKRIPQVLSAFAVTRAYVPGAHLVLVGAPAEHYDVAGDIQARALAAAVTLTGHVDDEAFTSYLAAADVSLNLRWPSAREVSGPWVRALAAGCPTVTTDLWHTSDVPGLDPRSWTVSHDWSSLTPPPPVTVKIDILDEDHSLRLAMRRLGTDPALRDELARAGRAWWQAEHSHDGMLDDYRRVVAGALAAPMVGPDPASNSAESWLGTLLAPFGLSQNPWSRI
jgi:glycosyltransferase involved in cell wall biosynthesis